MNHKVTLTVTSLLAIVLFSFHWADEVARGMEPGTLSAAAGLLILFVWLYATLVLVERRLGLIILLLGSVLGAGVPILHMKGAGLVGGWIAANSSGAFFWVWTLIALGASGMISVALSAHGLWSMRRGKTQ